MENRIHVIIQIMLLSIVACVTCRSFGVGSDVGRDFNRDGSLKGHNSFQNWRNGFSKRFGYDDDGLGNRNTPWIDWSKIIGANQKRGFGDDEMTRLGWYPAFRRPNIDFNVHDFLKRSDSK